MGEPGTDYLVSREIADWRLRIADCQDNVLFFNLQSAIRNSIISVAAPLHEELLIQCGNR